MKESPLAKALAPTLRLKLGKEIVTGGGTRFEVGEIVRARVAHLDKFGAEIVVCRDSASRPATPDEFALAGWGDLEGAEVVA